MDPADLMMRAAARGIDLNQIAGVASDLQGPARRRTLTLKEREDGLREVRETVKARETRTYKPPAFTVAELGQAGAGMGAVPWAAAMYSFAGSDKGYWLLWTALSQQAQRLARRDQWVNRIKKLDGQFYFYRDDLAELVLIDDAHKHLFASDPDAYASWFCMSPKLWRQDLDGPYRSLKDIYEGYLNTARGVIARWIRQDG